MLATLSVAKVSFVHGRPNIAYRQPQVWAAQETLLVTEQGFPEGRTIFPSIQTTAGSTSTFADPGRLSGLAVFYASLANSDAVRNRIPRKKDELPELVRAAPVVSNIGNATPLPMLTISGAATAPQDAIELTRAASGAFRSYIAQRQVDAGIPESQRIIVSVLNEPDKVMVIRPHKKTIPLMVFVAVLAATVGLALILENVRPRVRAVEPVPERDLAEHRPQQHPIAGVGRADAGS